MFSELRGPFPDNDNSEPLHKFYYLIQLMKPWGFFYNNDAQIAEKTHFQFHSERRLESRRRHGSIHYSAGYPSQMDINGIICI